MACAFAPVLAQTAREVPEAPFGWSVLLAPLLLIAALLRGRSSASPRPGWALPLLLAGLLLELIGLGGASPGIASVGLPIAVMGLALWSGAPPPMTALLAFWAVPVPDTFYGLTTPNVESAYAQIAAALANALGAQLDASGPLVRSATQRIEFDPHHSGIHQVYVVTALCWYAAVRRSLPPAVALARTALGALLAIPLQLVGACVAVGLLAAGAPDVANGWLDHGLWLLTAILAVSWIETR